jgi:uncharacterized protein with HEPN domain
VSSRNWQHRIEDTLDAIAEIQSFSAGATLEQFKTDAKTLKAIAADLIIIGEAANHIPDDVQDAHQDVPWVFMRAMRNRVVHVYFDVVPTFCGTPYTTTYQSSLTRLRDCLADLVVHQNIIRCQLPMIHLSRSRVGPRSGGTVRRTMKRHGGAALL